MAQGEFKRREMSGGITTGGRELSGKIICGECGGVYGPKVWHSTSKYRKVIWQCNGKYRKKGKRACSLPHIKEETVKQAFVEVYNGMVENKGNFISVLEQSLAGGTKSDEIVVALAKTEEQLGARKQKIKKLIDANARSAMDQKKYDRDYAALAKEHNRLEAEIQRLKDEKLLWDTRLVYRQDFIRQMKKYGKIIPEFDIGLFNGIVETVIVKEKNIFTFVFRDGTEIDRKY